MLHSAVLFSYRYITQGVIMTNLTQLLEARQYLETIFREKKLPKNFAKRFRHGGGAGTSIEAGTADFTISDEENGITYSVTIKPVLWGVSL